VSCLEPLLQGQRQMAREVVGWAHCACGTSSLYLLGGVESSRSQGIIINGMMTGLRNDVASAL